MRSSGLSQGFAWGEESEAQPGPQKSFRTGDGLMLAPEVLDHLFPQLDVGCPRGTFFSTLPSPNIKLIGCMFQKRSLSALGTQSLILPQGYLQQSWLSAWGSLPCSNWSCFALWLLVFPPSSSSPAAQGEFLAPRSLLCV